MKNPILYLNTDDAMSANSELRAQVSKNLNRIRIEHESQFRGTDVIQVFPDQIDKLVNFLQQSKKWIESGYKKEFKPNGDESEKIF
jgi:hypothetical protein